jgi:hypothetical protein
VTVLRLTDDIAAFSFYPGVQHYSPKRIERLPAGILRINIMKPTLEIAISNDFSHLTLMG